MRYPEGLQKLIAEMRKLPGVGGRTAERYAFQMLSWNENELSELSGAIGKLSSSVLPCETCHCLRGKEETCFSCSDLSRDRSLLCVVATAQDVYSIEETRAFRGVYHVLGGMLSPLTGKHPDMLDVNGLKKRIEDDSVREVIIALDSTLEGDTTALFIKEKLDNWNVAASRLAFGIPMGSSLDYVDGGTLIRAFEGRSAF